MRSAFQKQCLQHFLLRAVFGTEIADIEGHKMQGTNENYDVAVIGAGIAGASAAAELAAKGLRVAVIEQESQAGYHTTGRSAAIYSPVYGPAPIRALTRASFSFFTAPPDGFAVHPLLSPINAAFIARADQLDHLSNLEQDLAQAEGIARIDANSLQERIPLLRSGYASAGLWDTGTSNIDVAALHQGYLRQFKALGGMLITRARLTTLTHTARGWTLQTSQGDVHAEKVVNAAGAWADQIGQIAGAEKIGLIPKRRTALIVDAPQGTQIDALPIVIDVQEQFYLKPEGGKLLISPANEDPENPCDVQPDEMDIALCIDRIERAFDLSVRRVESSWAGLRSFVADKCPVAGFSGTAENFYWLAGQGGYGIQSAPALAKLVAADVTGQQIPAHILQEGLDPDALRPTRASL